MGFVAHIKGEKSHPDRGAAPDRAREPRHRGATGAIRAPATAPASSPDAARVLQARVRRALGIELPEAGEYGVGMLFLPHGRRHARRACADLDRAGHGAREAGLLGWRDVPVDPQACGDARARVAAVVPSVLRRAAAASGSSAFERKLYVHPPRHREAISDVGLGGTARFYVCSLSRRTIVYKGLLIADQMAKFYHDLLDPDFESGVRAGALALQHQHASRLEARAPLPLRLPQRRDQHAARQRQLDAARETQFAVGGVRRRPEEDAPVIADGRQRHGGVRQRARAAGADAAARCRTR